MFDILKESKLKNRISIILKKHRNVIFSVFFFLEISVCYQRRLLFIFDFSPSFVILFYQSIRHTPHLITHRSQTTQPSPHLITHRSQTTQPSPHPHFWSSGGECPWEKDVDIIEAEPKKCFICHTEKAGKCGAVWQKGPSGETLCFSCFKNTENACPVCYKRV